MAQQLEKTSDATALITAMVTRARTAQSVIGKSDFATRCAVLQAAATLIRAQKTSILEVNKKDVAAAKASGISGAFIDRLTLDDSGVEAMANGLEAMTRLHDPIGHELARWQQPSGLDITRISTPLGVIGIIYESRPNVTVDAAGLCIIAGNAAILRGGSDSQLTASLLASIMAEGLDMVGLPRDAVQMVPTTDRQAVGAMLGAVGGIDVVIPRGGRSLVERVQTEARVPVFAHLEGVCHVYVHSDADPEKARRIMLNAKMRRTGICGAAETLLIDKAVAATLLADITADLLAAGCALRGDAAACALVPAMTPATETDFYTEYLDAILSVAVVDDIDGAIAHIGKYGSAHTDAIITQSAAAAEQFFAEVDSAIVMQNASTQFADGGEFGMGAEIGIATGRLHARGPVGAAQLTSFKYVVRGDGQTRS
ncbi:MAG: glutamate-5-semialdehyde dehydrogenase [Proteobacteria bacterium]|nr:glutamate-5-semialdehyde dehydrogenase [Pseudomonadota bacterium]MDA0959592.1 glutamate-5-semialdehyde dehydrogenase [Pseudomonadota bacterium]MDA1151923.1 glutamate-5-semialdehyde dehydrogenase [Pseudomonadota bacterium]